MRQASRWIAVLVLAGVVLPAAAGAQTPPSIPGVTTTPAPTPSGAPLTRPIAAGAFAATVEGHGHFELRATLTGGGSFTVQADPAWSATYGSLVLPEEIVPSLQLAAAAAPGSPQPGSWKLGGSLPGLGPQPLTVFSCLGMLQAPTLGSADAGSVTVGGARIALTLPALPSLAAATSGCTPAQADGRATWSAELRTWTAGLLATSPQELLSHDTLERAIDVTTADGAAGRSIGPCHAAGMCEQDLRWTGAVTLTKRCRNFAGTAQAGGTGAFTCLSRCDGASCSRPVVRLASRQAAASTGRGSATATASCFGGTACTGVATLRAGGVLLARAAYRLRPTASGAIRIRLPRDARARVRRAGSLPATLRLTPGGTGVRTPATARITLSR